jgi:phenylalanyl-tRNA synthetase beta chain
MLYNTNLLSQRVSLPSDYTLLNTQLIAKLFEIEHGEVQRKYPELLVVGKVTDVQKHPNADTLFVCQVNCGAHGNFQICTGGENVQKDQFVPVALPGCYLSSIDLQISEREMRGQASNGMICSKGEMGINEDEDKHWIWNMAEDLKCEESMIGKSFAECFPRLQNTIFEVESVAITNRPDLWGHFGLACECRSIFSESVQTSDAINATINNASNFSLASLTDTSTSHSATVQTEKCSFYSLTSLPTILNEVSVFPGRVSLLDLGFTPKLNRIDYGNYFMTNYAQPIHIFDEKKIIWKISVQEAKGGEKFIDLTDKEHTLEAGDIIICDEEKIVGLAGIIGGKSTAYDSSTTSILIEVANFDAIQIRKTASRLGLKTDAAVRFEKGINPLWTAFCSQEQISLLNKNNEDYKTGAVKDFTFQSKIQPQNIPIILDLEKASYYLVASTDDQIINKIPKILENLGYQIKADTTTLSLTPPIWRSDIQYLQDVYEDIARHVGLENIPEIPSSIFVSKSKPSLIQFEYSLAQKLIDTFWFDQVETYPWYSESWITKLGLDKAKHLELLNPTDTNTPFMAQTLLPGLLNIIVKNHRQILPIKIFEIGKVFARDNKNKTETKMFAGMVANKKQSDWNKDTFLEAKEAVLGIFSKFGISAYLFIKTNNPNFHPSKQCSIQVEEKIIWFIGEIHPVLLEENKITSEHSVSYMALEMEALFNNKFSTENKGYSSLQDQLIRRDVSFALPVHEDFSNIIKAVKTTPWVERIEIFDLYDQKDGNKSISISFLIKSDGTMTNDQINTILNAVIANGEKAGGKLK